MKVTVELGELRTKTAEFEKTITISCYLITPISTLTDIEALLPWGVCHFLNPVRNVEVSYPRSFVGKPREKIIMQFVLWDTNLIQFGGIEQE